MRVGFDKIGASKAAKRRERIAILGGCTLIVALVTLGVLLTLHGQFAQAGKDVPVEPQINEEVAFGTVVLIAANTKIPKGTKLTPNYLREISWPRDQVPEGAIRSMVDLQNMYASAALPENQPILRSNISSTPPNFGISELLPPGHRAVTIQVNATTGVEGWANPGAHVDVLVTYPDPKDGTTITRVVVENAVVLSFDGKTERPDADGIEKNAPQFETSTVTVAVPFSESLKIQTALAMGRLTLVLRNPSDVVSSNTTEFSATDWDSRRHRDEQKRPANPKPGFAKIQEADGTEREFVLDSDNRWQAASGNDERY